MEEGFITSGKNKYGEFVIYRRNKNYADGFAKIVAGLQYEKNVIKILEKGEYDYFVDVGSNFGYHSVIASHYCDVVYAFEPHYLRYGFHLWNCRNRPNIVSFPYFVGEGEAYVPDRFNGMVGSRRNGREIGLEVNKISLKEILGQFPKEKKLLVKIDVEGNELDVVKSGDDLLTRPNTTYIIEKHFWEAEKWPEILELLKDFEVTLVQDTLKHNKTEIYLFRRD